MFRFKMHTKVLVAVLLLGQLIELNVNLCIALSIERDQPANRIKLFRQSLDLADQLFGGSPSEAISAADLGGIHDDDHANLLLRTMDLDVATGSGSRSGGSPIVSSSLEQTGLGRTDEMATNGGQLNQTMEVMRDGSGSAWSEDYQPGKPIRQALESTGYYEYFGEIHVGTPKQTFFVLFDISSSVFWLPSAECKSERCISRARFSANMSETYRQEKGKPMLRLNYDDEDIKVQARLARDSVSLAGLTLEDQLFGEALELDGQALDRMPVDGIIGLGLGPGFATSEQYLNTSSLNASDTNICDGQNQECLSREKIGKEFINPLATMQKQGLLKNPIYSLYLNNENEDRHLYNTHNGELIFGEIVDKYFVGDEIVYTPVTRQDFWEFRLSGVLLKQRDYASELERGCESDCPAILDTGNKFIGGHFKDVDLLNRRIGAEPRGDGTYAFHQCELNTMPDLVFEIAGKEFWLSPEEYVHKIYINQNLIGCISALKVVDSERYPFWILGEPFLRRHYVVFDFGQKRLGFARSQSSTSDEVDARLKRNPKYFGRGIEGASSQLD